MTIVLRKFSPWLGVLCPLPYQPSHPSYLILELCRPGTPLLCQRLCSVVPFCAQSKDTQDQRGVQAGPASSEQASSAQRCTDSQVQAPTQIHTQTPTPQGCVCARVTPYLPLSVRLPGSDSAQTPFLTADSPMLSLTAFASEQPVLVCAMMKESMHWVCLPCVPPPCVCQHGLCACRPLRPRG